MYSNLKVIALTVGAFVAVLATFVAMYGGQVGSLVTDTYLPGGGTVKAVGVGVYWDNACSSSVVSVDFGLVDPGSVENVTVFIRNEGNAAATLSLDTVNWSPSNASDFMTFSWDYGGQMIDPQDVVEVTFMLSVSPSIEGVADFGFDIVIVASD